MTVFRCRPSKFRLMSAYVIVELAVKDAAAKDRYSAAAGPIIKEFGGEFVAGGVWTALAGEPGLGSGAVIRFADRAAGMECRFRLIG